MISPLPPLLHTQSLKEYLTYKHGQYNLLPKLTGPAYDWWNLTRQYKDKHKINMR